MTSSWRQISTLAQRDLVTSDEHQPGQGSGDARVGLKLLAARARRTLAERGNPAAHQRLAELTHPDLVAGTVQDGVARGLAVALEEAISLCEPAPTPREDPFADEEVVTDKALRKLRDIPIASATAKARFGRKQGILLVDRKSGYQQSDCIQFEDRTDCGDLDGFVAQTGERPRIFSPRFLQTRELRRGAGRDRLLLTGRLGRTHKGYPCEVVLEGRQDQPGIHLSIRIDNRHENHRLRIRCYGMDRTSISDNGTPAWELVEYKERRFLAATLVRATGQLRTGSDTVSVPDAQCLGIIEHELCFFGTATN